MAHSFAKKLSSKTRNPSHPSRVSKIAKATKLAIAVATLVAVAAAACSSGERAELVDPAEVATTLAPPTTSAPLAPTTTVAPTQTAPETTLPPDQTANQPPPVTPNTDSGVEVVGTQPPPTQPPATQPPATTPPSSSNNGPQIRQLERTGVASPYGDSFSVTVLIANGNQQRQVHLYDTPNGNEIILPDGGLWYRNYFGGPIVMVVKEGNRNDEWVRVDVAARQIDPNGTCQPGTTCYKNDVGGWVRNQGFDWVTHQYHARIDLSERSVRVWNGNQIVAESMTVVGREMNSGSPAPTPVGTFFVKDKIPGPSPGYGPWVIQLSAYSTWLPEDEFGIPNISLHGTNRPQYMGQARSSGCIRVPNDIITQLYNTVPLGTVVEIVV